MAFSLNRSNDKILLRKVFSLMLEELASGAVVASDDEYAALRTDLIRLREFAEQESTADSMLRTAKAVTLAIETYNREITVLLRKQQRALQGVVGLMAEAGAAIAGEATPSVEKLQEIGTGLAGAQSVADIDNLPLHVGKCLQAFSQEMLVQREQADSLIVELRQEIERGPQEGGPPQPEAQDLEPITGLPPRELCLKAMHRPIPARKRRYVVTLVLNNLDAIHARFGDEIGDRVLCWFVDFVVQQIRPQDRLFRWSGPSLVLLIESTEVLGKIDTYVGRILAPRLEETFQIEGRSILIRIAATWLAFQLTTTVAQAERQIEKFTASQRNLAPQEQWQLDTLTAPQ